MNPDEKVQAIYKEAAGNNPLALDFLNAFHDYCHEIDDLIDEAKEDPERFVEILIHGNVMYGLPFFRMHAAVLGPQIILITSTYADSVKMERSELEWENRMADTLRFVGNDLVRMVAQLTGGWERMRSVSDKLHDLAYHCHHDKNGQPV